MHQYHDVHAVLPPGKKGCCWGTWLVYTLPHLEQQTLFQRLELLRHQLAGVPANLRSRSAILRRGKQTVTSTRLDAYLCPSDQTNAPISPRSTG